MAVVDVVERFWSYVDKSAGSEDCWLWTGGKNSWGYGYFSYRGRKVRAHRFAYSLANGPIIDDRLVLHSCDVRACVRPSHLRLGDQSENVKDEYRRFRRPPRALMPGAKIILVPVEEDDPWLRFSTPTPTR